MSWLLDRLRGLLDALEDLHNVDFAEDDAEGDPYML